MLAKLCAKCGRVIPYGQTLCPSCQSKRDENAKQYDHAIRDKRSAKFYRSADWMRLRNYCMMRDNNQCQECKRQGIVRPATEVHHIIPIRKDWTQRLNASNCVSLCHQHHMEIEHGKSMAGGTKKV